MAIVEIFKTNIETKRASRLMIARLQQVLPEARINFDLDDCDNILRIESAQPVCLEHIEQCFQEEGYTVANIDL